MGQGQTSAVTSGGSGGGGGNGAGILSMILGGVSGGGASMTGGAPPPSPSGPPPELVGPQQPSWVDKLKAFASDPKNIQALGDTISKVGGTIGAANKLPPGTEDLFTQAVVNSGGRGGAGPGPDNIVSGEEEFRLTPQMAKSLLEQMGIPAGFNPIVPRG